MTILPSILILLAALLFLAGAGMLGYVFLRPTGPTLAGLDPARAPQSGPALKRGPSPARQAS